MYFIDEQHKENYLDALKAAGAVREGGKIDTYYGASLYLLTGLTFAWSRLRRYVEPGCLDFEEMLGCGLSSGEALVVRLAGNFYNGGFWSGVSPWDIVSSLDGTHLELVLCAFRLRSQTLAVDDLFVA